MQLFQLEKVADTEERESLRQGVMGDMFDDYGSPWVAEVPYAVQASP